MKVYIAYQFRQGPWGGGNQFLKALAGQFANKGILAHTPAEADVVLFNSHHNLSELLDIRRKHSSLPMVHRVDGPIQLVRGFDREVDELIFTANSALAVATIFQSQWSRTKCHEAGFNPNKLETVIINAPDPLLFNADHTPGPPHEGPLRVIATSWAPSKGTEVYKWLDENLDDEKFQMTFVGNSNVEFRRLSMKPPMDSASLAMELRRHQVYLTGSRNDPCSNALIEALHCGLPALAANEGGHPEIVAERGLLFSSPSDIPDLLDQIASGYAEFQAAPRLPSLSSVAEAYEQFLRQAMLEPHVLFSAKTDESLTSALARTQRKPHVPAGALPRLLAKFFRARH